MNGTDEDLDVPRPAMDFEDLRAKACVARRLFGVDAPTRVDRFALQGRLGSGTYGVVYDAHDPRLDRTVALKVIELDPDDARGDALLGEARAAARLEHPAVVSVYDAGRTDALVWIAMERVRGESLRAWIDAGPKRWPEVAQLFARAAQGLHAAHEAGLVHRDFKPDNVLVEGQRPRIVDFGLAIDVEPIGPSLQSTLESTAPERTGTSARRLAGTPAYMAPEQARGEAARAPADQFAFFVSLFEALHGQRPFAGATLFEIHANIEAGQVRPKTARTPGWLDRIIARGLRADPAARWPDMATVARRLRAGLVRRSRRPWVLGAAAAALGLGLVAGRAVTPDPCREADAAADQTWGSEADARLRAQLEALAPPSDPDYTPRTAARFDAWVTRWRAGRREACETADAGALPRASEQARARCYADRLAAFEGLLGRVQRQDGGPLVAARIAGALDRLPDLGTCEDDEALARARVPGVDETAAHAELRADLHRLLGALTLPPDETTRAALDEVEGRAEALGDRGLQALAALLRAGAAQHGGDYDASLQRGRSSLHHAIASGDDAAAAEAALHSMWVAGELLRDPDRAAQFAELADAYILGLGDPATARVRWLDYRGVIDLAAGDVEAARSRLERALELRETDPQLEDTAFRTRLNLADAYRRDPAKALQITEQALEELRAHFGDAHPNVAMAWSNLGSFLQRLGRDEEARDALERALALKEAAYGPEHPALASTLSNLGALVPPAEAAGLYRRGLRILEPIVGADSPRLANLVFNLGIAEHDLGRHAQAREHYARFVEIHAEAAGEEHPSVLPGRVAIAAEQLHEGELETARTALEHLTADLDPTLDPYDRASAWIELARARAAQGADEGAAMAAAEAATACADLPECLPPDVRAWAEKDGIKAEGDATHPSR